MIWHIFRKDAKLLWRLALGVAALNAAATAIMESMGRFIDIRWSQTAEMLSAVGLLGGAFLIASAVQHEAIPSLRLDWLVRPIRRKDLLLAKMLFVVLMVQAPILAANFFATVAEGFSSGRALLVASSQSVYLLLMFYLPVLAFSSLTRNILEAVFGTVVSAIAFVVFATLILRPNGIMPSAASGTRLGWIADLSMLTVLLLGSAAVLSLQYFLRRTRPARVVTAAVAVLAISTTLLPLQPAFAIQQTRTPSSQVADRVVIRYAPDADGVRQVGSVQDYNRPAIILSVPLQISGLPSESLLVSENMEIRLTESDGRISQPFSRFPVNVYRETGENAAPDYQAFTVPAEIYNRIKDQPVRLDIDYSLTMFELISSRAFPAVHSDHRFPELGWCGTRVNPYDTAIDMSCVQAGKKPCMVAYLENPAGGQRNPLQSSCQADYAPYVAWHFGPESVEHFGWSFPFRSPTSRGSFEIPASQIKDSQLVVKTFRPLVHFKRSVTIPELRLGDWVRPNQ